jgi:neuromedin U receptor 1
VHYYFMPMFRDSFSGAPVDQSAFCRMLDIPEMLYVLSSLVFFLVPMVALVVLYSRMGLKIRQTGGQRVVQDGEREKTKKVMLKMFGNIDAGNITLVYDDEICSCCCGFFFVCWAPFHTQRLLYVAQFKHR